MLPRHLLVPCRNAGVRAALTEFAQAVETAASARQTLAGATSAANAAPLLRKDIGDLLSRAAESLTALGLQDPAARSSSSALNRPDGRTGAVQRGGCETKIIAGT